MLIHGVDLLERDDMVIAHQRRTGHAFEAESIAAWREACRGTVVDVGAYSGLYAIMAAQRGARVVAFEPNPVAFERLTENAERNGVTIEVHHAAVSDYCGRASLETNSRVRMTSGGRLISGDTVPVVTIDSLRLTDVAAVKIDVEGSEGAVLRGAMSTLRECLPLLITEVLSVGAYKEQHEILAPLGYASKRVDERNVIWRA